MDEKTVDAIAAEAATSEAIREVCQKTDPGALWEALEAEGIDTTPGVIYQVLNKSKDSEEPPEAAKQAKGLTPEDLATLGAIAARVGGVEQLAHLLEAAGNPEMPG